MNNIMSFLWKNDEWIFSSIRMNRCKKNENICVENFSYLLFSGSIEYEREETTLW
jgi:hypothetical protein